MIIDKQVKTTPWGVDIDFKNVNSIKNNIWLSIENSDIFSVKKLSQGNIDLIVSIASESLKWLVENNRAKKVSVIPTKMSVSMLRLNIYVENTQNNLQYEYFYNI
jgi:hypothetical protein